VEFSWRLRREHKIRDRRGKWILREVLYRKVPRELVDRPKVGFTVPIADWLRGALRPWAEDLLSGNRTGMGAGGGWSCGGLLDPSKVKAVWGELQRGNRSQALGLWAIVMLSGWLDRRRGRMA
ncbi:MAG TPA: asparagine synthase-related protein, partial [Gemmatimonadales bacterium]|nr:asparagine synthase-related protein [Gemmatimonadales bacterium]